MADDRSLSDLLWDYTVYAPIGLAISIAEELPRLSEKGRERIAGRAHIARVIGRFTVGEAQRRVGRVLDDESRPSVTSAAAPGQIREPGRASARPRTGVAADSSSLVTSSIHRSGNGSRAGRPPVATRVASDSSHAIEVAPASAPAARDAAVPAPAAASLAIPGYDTLAASHVVKRLSSLRPDELDAIRRYEIATRGRRTILHRIAQLAADR